MEAALFIVPATLAVLFWVISIAVAFARMSFGQSIFSKAHYLLLPLTVISIAGLCSAIGWNHAGIVLLFGVAIAAVFIGMLGFMKLILYLDE